METTFENLEKQANNSMVHLCLQHSLRLFPGKKYKQVLFPAKYLVMPEKREELLSFLLEHVKDLDFTYLDIEISAMRKFKNEDMSVHRPSDYSRAKTLVAILWYRKCEEYDLISPRLDVGRQSGDERSIPHNMPFGGRKAVEDVAEHLQRCFYGHRSSLGNIRSLDRWYLFSDEKFEILTGKSPV